MEGRTRLAANRLAAAGLSSGDRLVWSSVPSTAGLVTCLGALRLGLVVVPVNPAASELELAHVVADVRPSGAVLDEPDLGGLALDSGSLTVLGIDASSPRGRSGALHDASVLDNVGPEDPALIVYTSGTTGSPKGAVLSHGNLAAGAAALEEAWRLSSEDRLVLALPLFHVHGLCAGLFTMLSVGGSVDLLARFDTTEVLEACRRGASAFFGVPTMYHRLAAAEGVGALSSLRLCVSGSAPLAPVLWHRIAERAGVSVLERYGMTETLLTISNPYEGERRPGTVGLPLPGVKIRVEPARDGELLVEGPSVFSGYWERPAANEEAFDGSWFRTGDAALIGDDGYVSIQGRRGDLIISGGFNVYPAEVEDVLLAHEAVLEVAVSGRDSDEWGQEVHAWVVSSDATQAEGTIMAFAAERLAPYKRPRAVHFVDTLPKNAMGKIERNRLV